ncbi:MAG: Carbamate kinase 2 [Syntrophus sp. PtaB.Bin001]|nr:MAG: Carbamate kinase 2 [Syntrophus sp. PtaB.Bin001]
MNARWTGIIILTDVDRVYLNFGKAGQKGLEKVRLDDIKRFYAEGHFPPGNMGPKIEATIRFLETGGKRVVITLPELMGQALEGRAGTTILP